MPTQSLPREIKLISHSPLFYWWPVWVAGFLLAGWVYLRGEVGVSISGKTKVEAFSPFVLSIGERPLPAESALKQGSRVTTSSGPGLIFVTLLMVVAIATTTPLRSIVLFAGLLTAILLAWTGGWDWVVHRVPLLDVNINAAGYFVIASVLFVAWVGVFICDQQTYVIFQPGQFRIRSDAAEGEKAYDTMGVSLERQRGGLFLHDILGFGSGDLIIRTAGAQAQSFEIKNILFVRIKMQFVENLLRQRTAAW